MYYYKRFFNCLMAILIFYIFSPIEIYGFKEPQLSKINDNILIEIISINDFHGALLDDGNKNTGAANLVTELKKIKQNNPNAIIVSSGDNFNGTSISNLLYGEPVVKMFNIADVVYSSVGNHEFDWGIDKIELWREGGIKFLSANIVHKDTKELISFAEPYVIIEKEGIKIALIGLTTPETSYKTTPEIVRAFEFLEPAETAKEWVKVVRENENADIVVLLAHIGTFQDDDGNITFEQASLNLEMVEDVDAIITAHSHQIVNGILNDKIIVQAGHSGRAIANVTFEIDKDTKRIVSSKSNVDILAERRDELKEDEETKQMLEYYIEKASPTLGEVLGTTVNDMPHDRYELSVLGQWVAKVMKESAGADVAFTNAGGIRTSINAGEITMGKMYEVMPFDNVLSMFEMTGQQIKEILEHGIENNNIGWVQFYGLNVEYLPGQEAGKKIASVRLTNHEPIDMNKSYKVVTNDFMAAGGDGFITFLNAEFLGETVPVRELLVQKVASDKIIDFVFDDVALLRVQNISLIEQDGITQLEIAAEVLQTEDDFTGVKESLNDNIYTVVFGDNLSKIARMYNTTWQVLQQLNNLSNPHLIFPDDIIILP